MTDAGTNRPEERQEESAQEVTAAASAGTETEGFEPAWAVQEPDSEEPAVIRWDVPDADRYQLLAAPRDEGAPQVIDEADAPENLTYAPSFEDVPATYLVRALRGEELLATSTIGAGDPDAPADFKGYAEELENKKQGWEANAPHKPDEKKATGEPKTSIEGGYVKTVTPMTITRTPGSMVTFDAAGNNTLWPGSIVQGKYALKDPAQLVTVGISEKLRAKLEISVDTLEGVPDIKEVTPTHKQTLDAIKKAIQGAKRPGSRDYYLTETQGHAAREICLEVGVSAKYLAFEGSLNFKASHKTGCHTAVAYLRERAFTAMPSITDLNDFFSDKFTKEELEKLKSAGKIGPGNPPLYVSAVIYGRMLWFAVTTQETSTEIEAAIRASWRGFSGHADAKYREMLQKSTITALGKGGPGKLKELLTGVNGLKEYLKTEPVLTEYTIIGYQLKTFTDQIAKQSETAYYNATTWAKELVQCEVVAYDNDVLKGGTWQFTGSPKTTWSGKNQFNPPQVTVSPATDQGNGWWTVKFEADFTGEFRKGGNPLRDIIARAEHSYQRPVKAVQWPVNWGFYKKSNNERVAGDMFTTRFSPAKK